jgi:hypothetical protein
MKMRLILLSIVLFAWSCGSGTSSSESDSNGKKSDTAAEAIDMDDPIIEMNVLSFSAESNRTEIEVINRSDEPLTSVSLRLVFVGEDGNDLTTATGRRKDSPFQLARNPHVVGAKSRTVITAMNTIEEGTSNIRLEEVKGSTKSGETIEP